MAWLLEVVLTNNAVKQGRAVLVLGWVTARESMALVWKTKGFKPTLQDTCCTVAISVYNNHTGLHSPAHQAGSWWYLAAGLINLVQCVMHHIPKGVISRMCGSIYVGINSVGINVNSQLVLIHTPVRLSPKHPSQDLPWSMVQQ